MEFIKKIPVIGYLFRMIWAFCRLPKHLDQIYQTESDVSEHMSALRQEQEALRQEQEALRQEQEALRQEQEELRQILNEQISEQLVEMQKEHLSAIEELRRWNADRMNEIRGGQIAIGELQKEIRVLQQLKLSGEYIKKLNWILSANPTIWGDEDRLHISDLAAVSSCMFNTNSGHITVGDYTFAGSGVSILAGSHDMHLTGLLRRDAEIVEGCDITIGKGVWLASNCTILGPAVIEDNAVVAAGAVVTPGTKVSAGAIYGGVPAKYIGSIPLANEEDVSHSSVLKALERSNGVLYVTGWTEKTIREIQGNGYCGHFMRDDKAKILCQKDKLDLRYYIDNGKSCVLKVKIDNKNEMIYELKEKEGKISILLRASNVIYKENCVIEFEKEDMTTKLFFSVI